MINKYFKRRFKTIAGIKLAIFLKRPYDWVRLNLRGEKILRHEYHIYNKHSFVGKVTNSNGDDINPPGYTIWNMIWTQNMIDDLKEIGQPDIVAELEEVLKKELEKDKHNLK